MTLVKGLWWMFALILTLCIEEAAGGWVSVQRIQKLLTLPEIQGTHHRM